MVCWGSDRTGQLGSSVEFNDHSSIPVPVLGISNVLAMSADSYYHTCAVSDSGGGSGPVWCWGLNDNGELGDGTWVDSAVPVAVSDITNAIEVAVDGSSHSCAFLTTGAVKCWGWNSFGQLGNNDIFRNSQPEPVDVIGFPVVAPTPTPEPLNPPKNREAVGRDSYACGITSSGGVKCWGNGGGNNLGDGTNNSSLTPVAVNNVSGAISLSAGINTCALLGSGGIKCWGYNVHGANGGGYYTNFADLNTVTVVGITNAVQVTSGYGHNCALLATGEVKCWGSDDPSSGVFGFPNICTNIFGDQNPCATSPVSVSGLSNVIYVSAGTYYNCAVTSDHHVWCWGNITNSATPVQVLGIDNALAVAGNCAVLTTGGVKCWGSGPSAPVDIAGLSNVSRMSTGLTNCFVLTDGTVKCLNRQWGSTPTTVSGISGAVSVSTVADSDEGCTSLSTGGIMCWGSNTYGQLGNGTTKQPHSTTQPVNVIGFP